MHKRFEPRRRMARYGRDIAAALLAFAALAGSAGLAPAQQSARSGRISITSWQPLDQIDSKVSVVDADPAHPIPNAVGAREYDLNAAPGTYAEALQIPGGRLIFEMRQGDATKTNDSADNELIKRWNADDDVRALGIRLSPSNIVHQTDANGPISLISTNAGAVQCIFFFRYAGGSSTPATADGTTQAMTGGQCLPNGSAATAALANNMAATLADVQFDLGRYNQQQMFSAGLDEERRREAASAAAARNITVPPSVDVRDSLTTATATVTVTGTVKDAAGVDEVRINGMFARLDAQGRFSVDVPVGAGTSQVVVVATNVGKLETRKTITVRSGGGGGGGTVVGLAPLVFGRFQAIVIAEENYTDPKLGVLSTAGNDGRALAGVLQQQYGFQVNLLVNATKSQIAAAFQQAAQTLGPQDALLVYYAGHGIRDEKRSDKPGYWVPVDGTTSDPSNWYPNADIVAELKRINVAHLIVISDSCFSGTLTRDGGRDLMEVRDFTDAQIELLKRSRTALSSGNDGEVSISSLSKGDKDSPFAVSLLDVLRRNPGVVSGIQVANMVRGKMYPLREFQVPQYGAVLGAGHDDGSDFLFRKM